MSRMAERMNNVLAQLRRTAGTPKEDMAKARMAQLVAEAQVERDARQRGLVDPAALRVFAVIAIGVLAGALLAFGVWELGRVLMTDEDERALARDRKVWREKRRELRDSIAARRVR
jgi:hypothetical protein